MAMKRNLRPDESGSAVVEFAMVIPVFVLMIVGIFDVSMNLYTTSVVQGIMQKAGRDFSLEDARSRQAAMEARITEKVGKVAPNATIVFSRKAYFDFGDVEQPEEFDDMNGDGLCNDNEPFEDANDNGQWDSDRGETGFGGARDAVLFSATVTYPRLMPMASLIGLPDEVTIEASTVLRNQPFASQDRSLPVGKCS